MCVLSIVVIFKQGLEAWGDLMLGMQSLSWLRFLSYIVVDHNTQQRDVYRGSSDHSMVCLGMHQTLHCQAVPLCSRSGDIIEPMLCAQWYVGMKDASMV